MSILQVVFQVADSDLVSVVDVMWVYPCVTRWNSASNAVHVGEPVIRSDGGSAVELPPFELLVRAVLPPRWAHVSLCARGCQLHLHG